MKRGFIKNPEGGYRYIYSLIKYFGTKKDYCCQRYKRQQNCLINTKSFSEKVEVEIFVSHILFFQTLIDLLFLK